jgi:hypothetical protein
VTMNPIGALFFAPDLQVGGPGRHVVTMLPRMDSARFTPWVVCIGEEADLVEALPAAGVETRAPHQGERTGSVRVARTDSVTWWARPDGVAVRGNNAKTLDGIASRLAGVEHTIVWVHNIGDGKPRGSIRTAVDRARNGWTSSYSVSSRHSGFISWTNCPPRRKDSHRIQRVDRRCSTRTSPTN